MFSYTIQELGHLNARLKPALEIAKERKVESEQLALDAARIMVVHPLILNTLDKRRFYRRLLQAFGLADSKTPVDLYQVQRIAWRYLEKMVELDYLQVCMIGLIRNNLASLSIPDADAQTALRLMDRSLGDLLEKQKVKPAETGIETNIGLWLKQLSLTDYREHYPPCIRFLSLVTDFYNFKHGLWTFSELASLNKVLGQSGLPWQSGITLAEFLGNLLEEVDTLDIRDYIRLVDASFEGEDIDVMFVQDQVSSPVYLGLLRVAQGYTTTRELIEGLMQKTGLSRPMTIRETLLPFMGNQGINVNHVYTAERLAVEILAARYLTSRLHFDYRNAEAGTKRIFDPVTRFILAANGQEVKDSQTGLVWRRWSEGQANQPNPARAEVTVFGYDAAMDHATREASRTGLPWRLPTVEELAGLIDRSQGNPAISRKFFPDTPPKWFWSSTPGKGNAQNAWSVGFSHGSTNYVSKINPLAVRLVRG
jgi:hypothetical protein